MLPISRIEWLTGRTKYEITSISARIGRSTSGAEVIQNRCEEADAVLDEADDRHRQEHRDAPSSRSPPDGWSVVNAIGIRPRKFENTMKMNSVMM